MSATIPTSPLIAYCLCAQWCGACREFEPQWQRWSQTQALALRTQWLDVDSRAAVLETIDIDDFPSLLVIERPNTSAPLNQLIVRFAGPIIPQLTHVESLLASAQQLPAVTDAAWQQLAITLLQTEPDGKDRAQTV